MLFPNIICSAVIISYIHDDHRKLNVYYILHPSCITERIAYCLHVCLLRCLVTRHLYTVHSIVIRPQLEGGDPAAGSPTATLLRLLPRC
jgi:hypothetical protein